MTKGQRKVAADIADKIRTHWDEAWQSYRWECIPADACVGQVTDLKMAFCAGSLMTYVANQVASDRMADVAIGARMEMGSIILDRVMKHIQEEAKKANRRIL